MPPSFLLEIGHEELPASFVPLSGRGLLKGLQRVLDAQHVAYHGGRWFATPRRTAVYFEHIAERADVRLKKVMGPPKQVAYDPEGRPTRALLGFIKKLGVQLEDVREEETPKGVYLYAMVQEGGDSLEAILQAHLADILQAIPFPKVMRWQGSLKFPRPIRWIVALHGDNVLPIQLAGLQADRITYGNRMTHPDPIPLTRADEYLDRLRAADVWADAEERKRRVWEELVAAVEPVHGQPLEDPDLLEEVTHLVEAPRAVLGSFDPSFLALPAPVVVTAMKQHQRYFAVFDSQGRLLPHFVAIINNPKADVEKVRQGLEEVLQARLEDAAFYFEVDTQRKLEDRVEDLKGITWFPKLGTVYDKVKRVQTILQHLSRAIDAQGLTLDIPALTRAAWLYKTDLTTEMIRDGKEFTKLEGTIGKYYALHDGEPPKVAEIIEQSHFPRFSGDRLPEIPEAALLGIADRVDTLVALFHTGYEVKGAQDPMGLRRTAYALIDLILKFRFSLNLTDLFRWANFSAQAQQKALEFTLTRFEHYLEERQGIRYDIVDAVIGSGLSDLVILAKRAEVLNRMMKEAPEDFERLVIGQKRLANILKDFEGSGPPDPNLFEKEEERALYDRIQAIREPYLQAIHEHRYPQALRLLIETRELIDRFFDHVFVMVDDPRIRENRLKLLAATRSLYLAYADFSRIVIPSER